jgi:hypothetical protein
MVKGGYAMSKYILEENDYKILVYISKHDSVSKEKIINRFGNKIVGIETRIKNLATPDFTNGSWKIPISNTSYIIEEYDEVKDEIGATNTIPKGIYHITDFGKKVLQDYLSNVKSQKFDIYFNRALAVIAIFISIIALLKP